MADFNEIMEFLGLKDPSAPAPSPSPSPQPGSLVPVPRSTKLVPGQNTDADLSNNAAKFGWSPQEQQRIKEMRDTQYRQAPVPSPSNNDSLDATATKFINKFQPPR